MNQKITKYDNLTYLVTENYNVLVNKSTSPDYVLEKAKIKLLETCDCCRQTILSKVCSQNEYRVDMVLVSFSKGCYLGPTWWFMEYQGYRPASLAELLAFLTSSEKENIRGRFEILGSYFYKHQCHYAPLITADDNILMAGSMPCSAAPDTFFPFVKKVV